MALVATASGGSSIAPITEGTHIATCYAVVDNGIQHSETYNKDIRQVTLIWELADETFTTKDGDELPRSISKTYTLSIGEKANLRKDLVSWRGREFTPQELEGFEMKNILGVPCMMTVVHTKKADKVYANISAIMKMPKTMIAPPLESEKIYFDLEESELSLLDKLPEFLVTRIKSSVTYQDRMSAEDIDERFTDVEEAPYGGEDDELPF